MMRDAMRFSTKYGNSKLSSIGQPGASTPGAEMDASQATLGKLFSVPTGQNNMYYPSQSKRQCSKIMDEGVNNDEEKLVP